MNKVKNYSLLVLITFLLLTAWQLKRMTAKRNQERSDKERWQSNYFEANKLATENKNIVLTQKEFLRLRDKRISRLIDSLKIKPKTITKYVDRVIIQKETDTVEVPVQYIGENTYKIKDKGLCYVWEGNILTSGESVLNVTKTLFEYKNEFKDIFHWKQKGKFLFWKTYYKDKIEQTTSVKCGDVETRTVEIKR